MSDLARIEADIDAQVAERVKNGVCGCGCGTSITTGGNGRRKFVDQAHRQRHYRRKVRTVAEAEGVPPRVSLKLVHATNATDHRNGDAQKPRRKRQSKPRTGLSVYFPDRAATETVGRALRASRIELVRDTDPAAAQLDAAIAAVEKAIARHDVSAVEKALQRHYARKAA